MGRASGFSNEELSFGEGLAQMATGNVTLYDVLYLFDDPRDQAAIWVGIFITDVYKTIPMK